MLPLFARVWLYQMRIRGAELDAAHYAKAVSHYTRLHARAVARERRLRRASNEVRYPLRLPSRVNWSFLRRS